MSANKRTREWFIDTIWGKVAMLSMGDHRLPPMLLVHGFLDSCATFQPLLQLLPDTHYYVAFDKTGHGKSDSYPVGPLATSVTIIEVINAVVKHMKWEKLIVLTHSLAFIDILFYHQVYPGKITKIVALDPLPAVTNYYFMDHEPDYWFHFHYESYYKDYKRNFDKPSLITRERAAQMVMKRRAITREQADVALSRFLHHEEGDLYRFTLHHMTKRITQFPVQHDMLKSVITTNTPPTLALISTIRSDTLGREHSAAIMEELHNNGTTRFELIDGSHDVHITHPEYLVPYIEEFLSDELLCEVKAKL